MQATIPFARSVAVGGSCAMVPVGPLALCRLGSLAVVSVVPCGPLRYLVLPVIYATRGWSLFDVAALTLWPCTFCSDLLIITNVCRKKYKICVQYSQK